MKDKNINYFKMLNRLFCKHKYKILSGKECKYKNPYLWNNGSTKRANVICVKCDKVNNIDIFNDLSESNWYKEKREKYE